MGKVIGLAEQRIEAAQSEADKEACRDQAALEALGIEIRQISAYKTEILQRAERSINGEDKIDMYDRARRLKALFESAGVTMDVGNFNHLRSQIIAGSRTAINQFLPILENPAEQFCQNYALLMQDVNAFEDFRQTSAGKFLMAILQQRASAIAHNLSPFTPEEAQTWINNYSEQYPTAPGLESVLSDYVQGKTKSNLHKGFPNPDTGRFSLSEKRDLAQEDWAVYYEQYSAGIKLFLEEKGTSFTPEIINHLLDFLSPLKTYQVPLGITIENVHEHFLKERQQALKALDLNTFVLQQPSLGTDDIPTLKTALKIQSNT